MRSSEEYRVRKTHEFWVRTAAKDWRIVFLEMNARDTAVCFNKTNELALVAFPSAIENVRYGQQLWGQFFIVLNNGISRGNNRRRIETTTELSYDRPIGAKTVTNRTEEKRTKPFLVLLVGHSFLTAHIVPYVPEPCDRGSMRINDYDVTGWRRRYIAEGAKKGILFKTEIGRDILRIDLKRFVHRCEYRVRR